MFLYFAGDGNWFLGVNIEQGRIRDFNEGLKIKTAFRKIVDELDLTMVLTPSQSMLSINLYSLLII